ncbi:MAG TPA: alpha/beta fold hydrolase [Nocardioides sp.]|uniref:alpha/beta fold hydrolase n=1 Tax=Nocardioides sp. TaxID=35761 RepID=UPI002C4ECCCF|nr:alpha/beta fold hydrolase [Nocardioides sp.]HTW14359.1 alpha/beta fold hydrolase [Nocardioides sp.]
MRIDAFERDGLTFDVTDAGPEDGAPVVLLHGFPERATCWREVAPLLHARGMRTYAPDQRGYSPGARPGGRSSYTVPELVADVVALIERIGRPVHLVGHDWGANVGWSVAARHPELVTSWTAVSVPHPAAFVRAIKTTRQGLRSWYMGLFQLPFVVEGLARLPGGPIDQGLRRSGMTRDEVARFRSEIVEYGALPGALAWYRALPLSRGRGMGGRVRVPTTLVWSTEDTAIARPGVDGCADHVEAPYDLVVLDGVSHWIPTHAPQALADAILARAAGSVAG